LGAFPTQSTYRWYGADASPLFESSLEAPVISGSRGATSPDGWTRPIADKATARFTFRMIHGHRPRRSTPTSVPRTENVGDSRMVL